MTAVLILCLVMLAPYEARSTTIVKDAIPHEPDISNRLAKLEDVLESVLLKNAELESRIKRLEDENRRLKATAAKVDETQDSKAVGENSVVAENGAVATKDPRPMKTADNIITRRNSKLPRLVLSEDASICFTAVLSSTGLNNLGHGQTIVYKKAITNVGGGYHIHTGIFTAPVSGVYVFNFDTMFEPGDSQFLTIVQDGQDVLDSYGHGAGETRYITTSRTVVLQVNQGGEVWIKTADYSYSGPGIIHGYSHSSFSGWIL